MVRARRTLVKIYDSIPHTFFVGFCFGSEKSSPKFWVTLFYLLCLLRAHENIVVKQHGKLEYILYTILILGCSDNSRMRFNRYDKFIKKTSNLIPEWTHAYYN